MPTAPIAPNSAPEAASVRFCTLAIHGPYRQRARALCAGLPNVPWVVLTDEPGDFADMNVQAVRHVPTGPTARDFTTTRQGVGLAGGGGPAYYDKRHALTNALVGHDTAIFIDADCRFTAQPTMPAFRSGLAVLPTIQASIAEHLETCGSWRLPYFQDLAKELFGDDRALSSAPWCHEMCFALTKAGDGREAGFFEAWQAAEAFLRARGMYSGEGGIMGLASRAAGLACDYRSLRALMRVIEHEGGGPKIA